MSKDYVEKMFSRVDLKNKKLLEFEQFESFIKNTYNSITDDNINSVFNDLNIDKNAKISLEIFKKLVNEFQDRYLKEVFLSYDENKDGLINTKEMYKTLKGFDNKITEEEILLLIEKYDKNGDGCMDFDEFKSMVFHA